MRARSFAREKDRERERARERESERERKRERHRPRDIAIEQKEKEKVREREKDKRKRDREERERERERARCLTCNMTITVITRCFAQNCEAVDQKTIASCVSACDEHTGRYSCYCLFARSCSTSRQLPLCRLGCEDTRSERARARE